jgi:hypothetical protein
LGAGLLPVICCRYLLLWEAVIARRGELKVRLRAKARKVRQQSRRAFVVCGRYMRREEMRGMLCAFFSALARYINCL